jgi:thiol:disulfide interchange protein DsbD
MTRQALGGAACLVILLGAGANAARADAVVITEHVRAELVAAVETARPGQTITVGVNQKIKPRWHTYWQNSGDSGQATSIQWTLPGGTKAGDILWPPPRRIDIGPVTNYGYENDVTLLAEITLPAGIQPGTIMPLRADVDWLVCEDICIPEQVSLSLDIPVASTDTPSARGRALIDAARMLLPIDSPWPVSADIRDGALTLRVSGAELTADRVERVSFFPLDWGVIEHAAPQTFRAANGTLALHLKRANEKIPARLRGIMVIAEKSPASPSERAFAIDVASNVAAADVVGRALGTDAGVALALFWALLGGLILNLMPCVFPVLSIKVMSLLSHANVSPAKARLHGVAYTVGVLASFVTLAALLVGLKTAGAQIGWGFQFQSPLFVLLLAYLMFVVGLSQSGLFVIGAGATRLGGFLSGRHGYAESVASGVLAAVVATPCTAPFMGAAIAYGLAQPAPILLAVFATLGFGLALPYLALSSFPRFLRLLPKPGAWMESFKQFMAFPMYAAATWLVWVLGQQAGIDAVAAALAGMILIAFAAWLFGATRSKRVSRRRIGAGVAAMSVIASLALGFGVQQWATAAAPQGATTARPAFEPYSEARLQAARAEGRPVFINFTAAWCITCLVNEKAVLNQAAVSEAFADAKIVYLKGDWTRQDRAITAKLAEFNRNGVPLYVFYPAGHDSRPVVLPQILTADIVLRETRRIRNADASQP